MTFEESYARGRVIALETEIKYLTESLNYARRDNEQLKKEIEELKRIVAEQRTTNQPTQE